MRPESLTWFWLTCLFPGLQPYAETGPIFLHAEACERAEDAEALPELFGKTAAYIVRGYSADDRIVYGTGAVVPTAEIPDRAAELLARPDIAYLHMRSAKNNCYQCRIERLTDRQRKSPPQGCGGLLLHRAYGDQLNLYLAPMRTVWKEGSHERPDARRARIEKSSSSNCE